MKTTQVYELVNTAMGEALGVTNILQEDLENVVDAGKAIFDANAVDAYVKSLINHIGKVIFVDRVYTSTVPPILRDGWEFGSVLEKVQMDLLDATENDSWNLVNGQSYDPHVFYQPKVEAKFWNLKTSFDIDASITELQVKQSFSNSYQLNGFVSMIRNTIRKSITVKMDELIMRVINDLISKVIYDEYETGEYSTKSGVRAINLLKKYNDAYGTTLTVQNAMRDPAFIRFASFEIGVVSDRMKKINNVYNIGRKSRFTPKELQHIVLLSDFEKAASTYLYSETFHNEFVKLPDASTVPFWQGSGQDYNFNSISNINVVNSDGNEVNISGVLGVIFDRDACMVANEYNRVTSSYNPKAEFTNYFYKQDVSLFNDTNEQAVVFFIA